MSVILIVDIPTFFQEGEEVILITLVQRPIPQECVPLRSVNQLPLFPGAATPMTLFPEPIWSGQFTRPLIMMKPPTGFVEKPACVVARQLPLFAEAVRQLPLWNRWEKSQ